MHSLLFFRLGISSKVLLIKTMSSSYFWLNVYFIILIDSTWNAIAWLCFHLVHTQGEKSFKKQCVALKASIQDLCQPADHWYWLLDWSAGVTDIRAQLLISTTSTITVFRWSCNESDSLWFNNVLWFQWRRQISPVVSISDRTTLSLTLHEKCKI